MKITGNEPAYAKSAYVSGTNIDPPQTGLTIRQQFAMSAMQGMCANSNVSEAAANIGVRTGKTWEQIVAANSVYMADMLIAELNRTEADHV